jgi:hypothetical protein
MLQIIWEPVSLVCDTLARNFQAIDKGLVKFQ